MRVEIIPVEGLPEIAPGDDLATLIADRSTVRSGDVVVVTSKVVSKAEGRLVEVDPAEREAARREWAERESVRVVARRGDLLVAETAQGLVCAAAGVDGSNLPTDRLALLPLDPDGSAWGLRERLRARGADVAVILSDTFGRPWRAGQTNVAIGVSGLRPLRDHRGEKDAFGTLLEATVIAVADEIAGAAELVMGKTEGIPVALVRGLPQEALGDGTARDLLRSVEEDLFRTGAIEALEARRTVRTFSPRPLEPAVLQRAVSAAATAPSPHGSRSDRPWRFVWLRTRAARDAFLTEMEIAWRRDLEFDGVDAEVIERRVARSRAVLGGAPAVLACFVSVTGSDVYPDARRTLGERDMFIAAAGAAVQTLMLALTAQGIGSCWVSSSLFCPEEAAGALGLSGDWRAVGCVAAGYPVDTPEPRVPIDPEPFLDVR